MITYYETFELIKECAPAMYCTGETPLNELGLDPLDVLNGLITLGELDIRFKTESGFKLDVAGDNTVIFSQPIATLETPIAEISTLGMLAKEIEHIFKENDEYCESTCGYDLISTAECDSTECGWYTEDSSWQYTNLNASCFIKLINEKYNVQIEKKSITAFHGSVKELCASLTDRINRAIEFH